MPTFQPTRHDCGGMDRLSGAPPLHLGWVRRGARPRGVARTHARGLRRWRRAKRLGTEHWLLGRATRAGTGYARKTSDKDSSRHAVHVDTLEAGARAAADVFKKYGLRAYAGSRLD